MIDVGKDYSKDRKSDYTAESDDGYVVGAVDAHLKFYSYTIILLKQEMAFILMTLFVIHVCSCILYTIVGVVCK